MYGVYYGYSLRTIRKNEVNHSKNISCQGTQPECVVSSSTHSMNIPSNTRRHEKDVKAVKAETEDEVMDKLTVFDNILDVKNYV